MVCDSVCVSWNSGSGDLRENPKKSPTLRLWLVVYKGILPQAEKMPGLRIHIGYTVFNIYIYIDIYVCNFVKKTMALKYMRSRILGGEKSENTWNYHLSGGFNKKKVATNGCQALEINNAKCSKFMDSVLSTSTDTRVSSHQPWYPMFQYDLIYPNWFEYPAFFQ